LNVSRVHQSGSLAPFLALKKADGMRPKYLTNKVDAPTLAAREIPVSVSALRLNNDGADLAAGFDGFMRCGRFV
jgi:hypothetical protein